MTAHSGTRSAEVYPLIINNNMIIIINKNKNNSNTNKNINIIIITIIITYSTTWVLIVWGSDVGEWKIIQVGTLPSITARPLVGRQYPKP